MLRLMVRMWFACNRSNANLKAVVHRVVACFFIVSKTRLTNKYTVAKDLALARGTILVPVWAVPKKEEIPQATKDKILELYALKDVTFDENIEIDHKAEPEKQGTSECYVEEIRSDRFLEKLKTYDFMKKIQSRRVRYSSSSYPHTIVMTQL